jgi:hypothetical protein
MQSASLQLIQTDEGAHRGCTVFLPEPDKSSPSGLLRRPNNNARLQTLRTESLAVRSAQLAGLAAEFAYCQRFVPGIQERKDDFGGGRQSNNTKLAEPFFHFQNLKALADLREFNVECGHLWLNSLKRPDQQPVPTISVPESMPH